MMLHPVSCLLVTGFIDFIVGPSLEVCGELLDKVYISECCGSTVKPRDEAADVRYQSLTALSDPANAPTSEQRQESRDESGSSSKRYPN